MAPLPAARLAPAAIAFTSAFAGGALLTQTVVVPQWRALAPAAFLAGFGTSGPVTGLTLFPFELASVVLLGLTARAAGRRRRPGRVEWYLATACMAASLLLLAYFVPANLALLDPAFPPESVAAVLTVWNRWDWARAGLGMAAAVLACVAAGRDGVRVGRRATDPDTGNEPWLRRRRTGRGS